MLKHTFFALLLLLTADGFTQQLIKGRILSTDKKPVPYANIGILNTSVGTLSNEDGTFQISIPDKHLYDTILFSALGHERQSIPVRSLTHKNDVTVLLAEKAITLEQVVVDAKKRKSYSLGNRFTKGGFLYLDSISAGSAMALLIDNKYPSYHESLTFPFMLQEVNFFVDKNTVNNFKIRVRFLARDPVSGQPTKDLFARNIITTSSIKKGWINVDLKLYKLVINKPFFLMLEWIIDDKDRLALLNQYAVYRKNYPDRVRADSTVVDGKKVGFWNYLGFSPGTYLGISPIPFSLQNYTGYYRTNSFGEWKRSPVVLTTRVSVIPLSERENSTSTLNVDPVTAGDKLCTDFLLNHTINGMQIAVMKGGQMVLSKGYGLADVEKETAVTTKTRFRIGSISKSITSAALLKLQKEGALDPDRPIQTYLPSFMKQGALITTRQLAGHIAGIRHYNDGDIDDLVRNEDFSSAIDALKIIKDDTLLFKPGTRYHYSSYGWNIIGAVIESVSGQSYLSYIDQYVCKPFNMMNTQGATEANLMNNCSRGYLNNGEEFSKENFSYKYASGGLIATSEDLVAFGYALLKARTDSLTGQLFQTMHLNNGTATNYGIGWNIGRDMNSHPIFFHACTMINGSGYLILYPEDDMVVAFLANGPDGVLFELQKLAALYYQKQSP